MTEEYIFKNNDKYIIKRYFNNTEYQFGTYDSLEDAKNSLNELEKDGWPIKTNNMISSSNETKIPENVYKNNYNYDIKVGKAYKHGFLVLKRKDCYEFFPKISYENECDIILDGIKSKARLNFVPRLVIDRKNKKLIDYLKKMSEIDPDQRKIVTLIKQNTNNSIIEDNNYLIEENKKLKEKIQELTDKIDELYAFSKKIDEK